MKTFSKRFRDKFPNWHGWPVPPPIAGGDAGHDGDEPGHTHGLNGEVNPPVPVAGFGQGLTVNTSSSFRVVDGGVVYLADGVPKFQPIDSLKPATDPSLEQQMSEIAGAIAFANGRQIPTGEDIFAAAVQMGLEEHPSTGAPPSFQLIESGGQLFGFNPKDPTNVVPLNLSSLDPLEVQRANANDREIDARIQFNEGQLELDQARLALAQEQGDRSHAVQLGNLVQRREESLQQDRQFQQRLAEDARQFAASMGFNYDKLAADIGVANANILLRSTELSQDAAMFNSLRDFEAAESQADRQLTLANLRAADETNRLQLERGVISDISDAASRPQDFGRLNALLTSGGASPLSTALATGETGVTGDALQPVAAGISLLDRIRQPNQNLFGGLAAEATDLSPTPDVAPPPDPALVQAPQRPLFSAPAPAPVQSPTTITPSAPGGAPAAAPSPTIDGGPIVSSTMNDPGGALFGAPSMTLNTNVTGDTLLNSVDAVFGPGTAQQLMAAGATFAGVNAPGTLDQTQNPAGTPERRFEETQTATLPGFAHGGMTQAPLFTVGEAAPQATETVLNPTGAPLQVIPTPGANPVGVPGFQFGTTPDLFGQFFNNNPADIARAALFNQQVQQAALQRSGFGSFANASPVALSAPGTFRTQQQLGESVAATRGLGGDAFFEELNRSRPTGINQGVVRRTF